MAVPSKAGVSLDNQPLAMTAASIQAALHTIRDTTVGLQPDAFGSMQQTPSA
jgi:hypothetical protein